MIFKRYLNFKYLLNFVFLTINQLNSIVHSDDIISRTSYALIYQGKNVNTQKSFFVLEWKVKRVNNFALV